MAAPQETEVANDPTPASPFTDLYERSHAAEFGISTSEFQRMLEDLSTRHAAEENFETFCTGLRIEDLALARACAAGSERAWAVQQARRTP